MPPAPARPALGPTLPLAGAALLALAGCSADGGPDDGSPPEPPPGARDSLNPALYLEGGVFVKGSHDEGAQNPAGPFATYGETARRVAVDGFWMQRHEVTNAEHRRFDPDHDFPPGEERHPVERLTRMEAMAYAASLGGRLPTAEEWEDAARGTESRRYPWGGAGPTFQRAHFRGCASPGVGFRVVWPLDGGG